MDDSYGEEVSTPLTPSRQPAVLKLLKAMDQHHLWMAAILVFYMIFQGAPYLESYPLASTMTTESVTFKSKSAAFFVVPDVLIPRLRSIVTSTSFIHSFIHMASSDGNASVDGSDKL